MGQNSSDAAKEDAQITLKREECATSTGQMLSANDVTLKIAQVLLKREECAPNMEQRENTNDAVLRDAQIKLTKEECARGMGQRSDVEPGGVQIWLGWEGSAIVIEQNKRIQETNAKLPTRQSK